MKKILIVHDLYALVWQEQTFLNREDLKLFVASSNEEVLEIHRAEHVDLIVTRLETPRMGTAVLCSLIREDAALRRVSVIVTCPNTTEAIKASSQCRANAVIPEPVPPDILIAKAQQLLFVAVRESLRVLLSAEVESQAQGHSFYCRTSNVSVSGMLIETDRVLVEGTPLVCQFYLPSSRKVHAGSRVVRIIECSPGEEYQYGLVFTDLSDNDRRLLEEYVRETSARSGQATV